MFTNPSLIGHELFHFSFLFKEKHPFSNNLLPLSSRLISGPQAMRFQLHPGFFIPVFMNGKAAAPLSRFHRISVSFCYSYETSVNFYGSYCHSMDVTMPS